MTTVQPETQTTEARKAEVTVYDNVGMPATYRCDRCGAQAYVEVELTTKSVLLFCVHHYNENESKLLATAHRVIDHRLFVQHQERAFKGQSA